MKTTHITKVVAVVLTVVMLVGMIPSTVLPVFASNAGEKNVFASIFDSVVLGKDTVNSKVNYSAGNNGKDPAGAIVVNDAFSPYEPYSTNDEQHPFLPNGPAWIDLSQIHYGAPATQNYPLTAWSANTSVYNITGTDNYYTEGAAKGKEIFSFADHDLINEYLWKEFYQNVYKNYNKDGTSTDAYGAKFNYVSENGVISSATDGTGNGLIVNNNQVTGNITHNVTSKYGDTTAFVYNRYDAMQGKWGLTLDKNVSSVAWSPSQVYHYYGNNKHLNNSYLYLSDTPYLYFSTEAVPGTQVAISILIGTPVQDEEKKKAPSGRNLSQTNNVTNKKNGNNPEYEYRWYTITDNALRPNWEKESMDYDMIPHVFVSEPVMVDNIGDKSDDIGTTLTYIANGYIADRQWGSDPTYTVEADIDRLNPIALAEKRVDSNGNKIVQDINALYNNGSMTGCIDFTNILPLVMASNEKELDANGNVKKDDEGKDIYLDSPGNGREGVKYRILQMRVDTKTAEGKKEDSAMRLNYLYFGPALSTVYTPQNTVGSTINAANWQYGQNTSNVGIGNSEEEANKVSFSEDKHINTGYYGSAYTSGWVNGSAVTITNTPNNPQKITIDTLGNGDGQLIINQNNDMQFCIDNNFASSFTNATDRKGYSGIWKYTVGTGDDKKEIKLEAIKQDGDWYVTVGIPIRKWVNLLNDSRKMSFTLTMEKYAEAIKDANGGEIANQTVNGAKINPNFCLWGNNDGSIGTGHSDKGTRFHNEDMIAVFGQGGIYQLDRQQAYYSALIDETVGQSVVYNTQIPEMFIHQDGVFETKSDFFTDQKYWKFYYKGRYKTYTDGETVYYVNNDTTIYTATHLTSATKPTYLKYIDITDWDEETNATAPAYYYDPATGKMYNSDLTTENTTLAPSMLKPVYGMTLVNNVNVADLEPYYTNNESWFDMLRSPYTLDAKLTVRNADVINKGITEEMYGYTYLTTMRIVVPLGAVMSIQNMKGDANSAGLNSYSTEGNIVSAYDGGTGAQPVVDTNGKANHQTANGNNSFTNNSTKVNATLRSTSAAYGPYIPGSNYTIYDILDTENRETSIYGVPYKATTKLNVFNIPYGKNSWQKFSYCENGKDNGTTKKLSANVLGTILSGNEFIVYGIIKTTDGASGKSSELWGMVGVRKEGGYSDVGWVQLSVGSTWNVDQQSNSMKLAFDAQTESGYTYTRSTFDITITQKALMQKMVGKWHFSNGCETYTGNYYTKKNTGTDSATDQTVNIEKVNYDVDDIIFKRFSKFYPTLMFANMDRGSYNNTTNIKATSLAVENTTDFKFKISNVSGWQAAAISKQLANPIKLKVEPNGDEKSWPVLYFDVDGNSKAIRVSLVLNVNGTPKLYAVETTGLNSTYSQTFWGSTQGYLSFRDIMSGAGYSFDNLKDGKDNNTATIEVLGVTISATDDNGVAHDIRRLEVWQDETPYLDKFYTTEGGSTNGADKNVKVADAFNIINDAFYYTHDEANDNGSLVKTNSNKGWSGQVRIYDTDGVKVTTKYTGASSKAGVYEYRTALGHLRVWVPANRRADIVFTSDRSFSTQNYKYLYYSYAMRDVDTGITAEDNNVTDNGFAIALKSQQSGSRGAYVESEGNFIYYDINTNYMNNKGLHEVKYQTTVTAAVDLESLTSIESINQIVVYMNNTESKTAEFYLNYIMLSNTPPIGDLAKEVTKEVTQYYYLMDNTGDRYSARFPTLDNPTGQVTGESTATDRVNPIIVKRGDRLNQGTYFNGQPLQTYDGYDNKNQYASNKNPMKDIMFYTGQSNRESSDIQDFYVYKESNGDKVADEYDMKWSYGRWDTGSGESDMNTMFLSKDTQLPSGNLVRRFATENYVLLRGGIEPKKFATYFDASGGEFIYENSNTDLQNLQKFAENSYYTTKTPIQTYFESPEVYKGTYEGTPIHFTESNGVYTAENGQKFTATQYSIMYDGDKYTAKEGIESGAKYRIAKFFGKDDENNTTQLTYSWQDFDRDGVIDSGEVYDHYYIQKPGYLFSHWEHYGDTNLNPNTSFNVVNGSSTSPDGNGAKLLKFTKKVRATQDYFKAVWIEDPSAVGISYTATFYPSETDATGNKNLFTTISTTDEGGMSKVNGKFILTIPRVTNLIADGERVNVYGWYRYDEKTKKADKSKIFSPSDKLYLLKNTKFVPATSASYETPDGETVTLDNLFTMEVSGARLWAITINGHKQPVTDHGVTEVAITDKNGNVTGYNYSNIVANRHYRAVPIGNAKDGYGWTSVVKNANENGMVEKELLVNGSAPIISNNKEFDFYPHENLNIKYSKISTSKKVFVTSTPSTKKSSRTMMVYTRFNTTDSNVKIEAAGTIRAIDPNFTNAVGKNGTSFNTANINSIMQLNTDSINADTVLTGAFTTKNTTAFAQKKATEYSKFGEFYLSSTYAYPKERTYYMRGYVIYSLNSEGNANYYVEYSDVVGVTGVPEIQTQSVE